MIWKFTDNKSRDSIEQQFDWARNMNEVPQDKLYHAEGNVAVHIWKVIEELQQLPAYSDLGGPGQRDIVDGCFVAMMWKSGRPQWSKAMAVLLQEDMHVRGNIRSVLCCIGISRHLLRFVKK